MEKVFFHQSQRCNLLFQLLEDNILCVLFYQSHFQAIKQKVYLLLEKFCWYFCLIFIQVILKPDFNCCNSFALSWVDKVTTGTESFVSVILNFVSPFVEEITQSSDQFKMRLISQLINGVSRSLRRNYLTILMTLPF